GIDAAVGVDGIARLIDVEIDWIAAGIERKSSGRSRSCGSRWTGNRVVADVIQIHMFDIAFAGAAGVSRGLLPVIDDIVFEIEIVGVAVIGAWARIAVQIVRVQIVSVGHIGIGSRANERSVGVSGSQ